MKITDTQAHTLRVLIAGLNAWPQSEEGQAHADVLNRYADSVLGPLSLDVVESPAEAIACPPTANLIGADGLTYYPENYGKGPVWQQAFTGREFDATELPLPATVQR